MQDSKHNESERHLPRQNEGSFNVGFVLAPKLVFSHKN